MLPDTTFVKAHGLDKHITEAVEGVLRSTGRKREDIAKIVLYGPDARTHAALVRQLRAFCLLGLAAALEECHPGDQVLVVSYGSGAEALLFQCTDALARASLHRPVSAQLARGAPLVHYGKPLSFRRHVETEVMRSFSSVPTMVPRGAPGPAPLRPEVPGLRGRVLPAPAPLLAVLRIWRAAAASTRS